MFSNDAKVFLIVSEVEVVSGEGVSEEVELDGITSLDLVVVEDHLLTEIGSVTVLQVKTGEDVGLSTLVFQADSSTESVESIVSLDLAGNDHGLSNFVCAEVTPDSD